MLEVSERIAIDQPVDVVRSHFADVAYHARSGVHRGVSFVVVDDDDEQCTYDQVTRLGPVRLRQSFRLDRRDPAHQVNTLVAGAFAPGSITFDIGPADSGATVVTATVRSQARGLTARLAPVLRRPLSRSLARSLAEDRHDLESGAYSSAGRLQRPVERAPARAPKDRRPQRSAPGPPQPGDD